ncbi:MAG: trehalose-phosphatase, partial [Actinomycetota bacterium]|nr:trehalose-phosphatase [Actinomycetota bacterium]
VERLAELGRVLGRVAIITGRPAAVAVEYAGLAGVPGLERLVVLGHYGLERWDAASGEVVAPPPSAGVVTVREALPALLERLGAPAGTDIEDKGNSVAVHTRRAAAADDVIERLRGPLEELAREHGLVAEPGRRVIELRPPGVDKGGALRGLVEAEPPSAVLFAGDDLGDLAAFDEVDRMRERGIPGLLVCSGSEEVTEVARRADLIVDGPDGVVDLLAALTAALPAAAD